MSFAVLGIKWRQRPTIESNCRKVPKFSDARKLSCNFPKIQNQRSNIRVFHRKDANGKANSEDPDQTAPLRAV